MRDRSEGDYLWWASRLGVAPRGGDGGDEREPHVLDLLQFVTRTMCHDCEPARAASWHRLRRAVEIALTTP